MKNIPLLFFISLFLFACNGFQKNTGEKEIQSLRKFYFPIEDLMGDGLVYEYLDDSLKVVADYTLYKTVKDEAGDLFLIAAGYNGCVNIELWKRMQKESQEGDYDALENLLRSHPYSEKRAKCSRSHILDNYGFDCSNEE